MGYSAKVLASVKSVERDNWNALTNENPFMSHGFFENLENSKSLEPQGWYSNHIAVSDQKEVVGILPLFLRDNSYGEFVFDWAWADAFQRAGGKYYPKLVSAAPFSPVAGPRLLVEKSNKDAKAIKQALIESAINLCDQNNLSSWHSLFFQPEEEEQLYSDNQLLIRTGVQYHWFNRSFKNFEEFLGQLRSRERKEIKRERRKVAETDLSFEAVSGENITEEHWSIFYKFYCSTFIKKWGEPRFTERFFFDLRRYSDFKPVLFFAKSKESSAYVAGALAIEGKDTLFGRHWGCDQYYSNLHFELCYYQTIDYCIKKGISRLDAGAQGEHKLKRGFSPVKTFSAHWINNKDFKNAISNFLNEERTAINEYLVSINKK